MMTRRRGWSSAPGAIRWRKCFSMSRAGAIARRRNERARAAGVLAAPCGRDGAALLVSVALVVRAADRADLLADRADADVGLPANLSRWPGEPLCARRRRAGRRGDAVGHSVSRAARILHLVSRRDVRAQSRQPDD